MIPIHSQASHYYPDYKDGVIYKPYTTETIAQIQRVGTTSPKLDYCSCVDYARAVTGFSGAVGYAKNWPTNSYYPVAGGVVVTSESSAGTSTGHVAIIDKIESGFLILKEANYSKCRLTSGRLLALDNPTIIGYWVK